MNARDVAFVGALAYQFPDVADILQEHLDD
jgi:hypothetical protein